MSSRRIAIFDTTLRDGEQSPGIALRPDEKAEIAEQLERLGVDVIEAGFAAASPGTSRACAPSRAPSTRRPSPRSPARGARTSTRRAEALAGAPRSRLHIFLATSPIHMEKKLGLSRTRWRTQAAGRSRYARGRVDEVEFSCEDATRSDPAFVAQVCGRAVDAGADVINLPDTVGYALPERVPRFHPRGRRHCRPLEHVVLSAHCHDDLGLAVANSLAGVEAGVGQVECTVNGIGERAGNAALEEIVMALRVRAKPPSECETGVASGRDRAGLAARRTLTGYAVPPNKAIVGANAFAHEAGIHQDGVLKDVSTYQIIDPAELGVAMTLPLGKHSGRHAFARACSEAGVELERDALAGAFADSSRSPTRATASRSTTFSWR